MALDARRRSAGLVGRVAALGLGLGLGLGAGCLLELERGVSCGDGWVDLESGEACDPKDPTGAHLSACRDQGWKIDAGCDPQTCQIQATELDCSFCGDGVASGNEACDQSDLRGAVCPMGGAGEVHCNDDCTLDLSDCPEVCGDGIVSGQEECDPQNSCNDDEDCGPERVCSALLGECVLVGEDFAPNLACSNYETTAIDVDKNYSSGTISRCTSECFFGRNDCSFCGDELLDDAYTDFVWPNAVDVDFDAEVCDGDEVADIEALADYCRPLCVDGPVDPNLAVLCDFECKDDCSGFALPDDIAPGEVTPESLGCCLAPGTICPLANADVPDLPCCFWLEQPDRGETCTWSTTPPIAEICPGQ